MIFKIVIYNGNHAKNPHTKDALLYDDCSGNIYTRPCFNAFLKGAIYF